MQKGYMYFESKCNVIALKWGGGSKWSGRQFSVTGLYHVGHFGLYMESCTCNYFFQARHGYTSLIGVDYSEGAINLAKSIAVAEQVKIKFLVCFFKFDNMNSQK